MNPPELHIDRISTGIEVPEAIGRNPQGTSHTGNKRVTAGKARDRKSPECPKARAISVVDWMPSDDHQSVRKPPGEDH